MHVLREDQPLWTRHDGAGEPGAQLSSWSFVENLKRYAREAGIGKIHLHQTRHTFARMVARRSGSLSETQDALGHRHASTTRIYVESIAVKTDKYSQHILEALVRWSRFDGHQCGLENKRHDHEKEIFQFISPASQDDPTQI